VAVRVWESVAAIAHRVGPEIATRDDFPNPKLFPPSQPPNPKLHPTFPETARALSALLRQTPLES
jgi:hypothetical protein